MNRILQVSFTCLSQSPISSTTFSSRKFNMCILYYPVIFVVEFWFILIGRFKSNHLHRGTCTEGRYTRAVLVNQRLVYATWKFTSSFLFMGIFLRLQVLSNTSRRWCKERLYVQKSVVINQIDWNFFFKSFVCLFVSFFYSMYLLYLELLFHGKFSCRFNFEFIFHDQLPSSQTFSPCFHCPSHWQCIGSGKVALPLLCRCQVLQTKVCCAFIYDQTCVSFLFLSSSNSWFGASLVILFELLWLRTILYLWFVVSVKQIWSDFN